MPIAALPWRAGPTGTDVLLVTSRRRGRLTLPKGWPMRLKSASEAAAIEALEEAGVSGRIQPAPTGSYRTTKLVGGTWVPVEVTVFTLEVGSVLDDWKEAGQRTRHWIAVEEASTRVEDPGLAGLLDRFRLADPMVTCSPRTLTPTS